MTERRSAHNPSAKRADPRSNEARPDAEQSASCLIVGIGASVGGLEAFRTFFANMPPDAGMAFVLVQHLAPDHTSILTELIRHSTAMDVAEATDGAAVLPDHVYVIPPNATLTVAEGRLRVTKPAPSRENRRPIDTFMFSLAQDQGENAVCVILSGSGSDGAQGLAAIKEHGGITLAQAQFDETAMTGMPSNAAATGLVDHVLPVDAMPAKLIEYQRRRTDLQGGRDIDGAPRDARPYLPEVCALLDKRIGHDFSQYKEGTLVRRIQRRMHIRNLDSVAEYIAHLHQEPRELELLFRDLLIGVTHFFRDPEAFTALGTIVIPELLKDRRAEDQVRVWVPGCATGEEVYSIAILLQEAAEKLSAVPKFAIFGTDINDTAIAIARAGRYHKSRLDGLFSQRLERWFVKDGDYCSPVPEIREMCVFSLHSVVKDPPFSKLHLISCRNLLIYMDTPAQDRLVRIFHYALQPGAFLFLGPSETVTRHAELFSVLDKKHHLFRRNDAPAESLPKFELTDSIRTGRDEVAPARHPPAPEPLFDRGARRVMEKYSPAYVVIDSQHQVVKFSGQIGRYLEPSEGTPSFNLFNLIQSALRPSVRAALRDAAKTQQRVTQRNIPIVVDGKSQAINLLVEPILQASGSANHLVIAFQDRSSIEDGDRDTQIDADNPTALNLENELLATRARLQAAIDEAERANDELRGANEEYRSANEEIQSSNEELEASKEELQSINEELQTLNNELSRKNETLSHVNSDLQNFLESTQIAMLFLNDDLHVRNFTPPAIDIFRLRDSDRGRPITDIVNRIGYQALKEDVRESLRSLTVVEREVYVPESDTTYLMRIRPYRTVARVVDGVVITFVDISDRKRREVAHALLAALVDSSRDAMIGYTLDGIITSWNAAAEQMLGYAATEVIGRHISIISPVPQSDETQELLGKIARGERVEHFETTRRTKDGRSIGVSLAISPIRDANGQVIGASKVARDVTERLETEKQRRLLSAELDHRVKNTLATVQTIALLTAQRAATIEEFRDTFDKRLMSLAQTHNLLTLSHWERVSLRQLLAAELSPYGGEGEQRFSMVGADVSLSPKQALALGLAFHELATNAAKYGAFSVPDGGLVEISWEVSAPHGEMMLQIQWSESGGPTVAKPSTRGFGSRLIERGLQRELDAQVEFEFLPQGVRCLMRIPLSTEGA
jgi:two-component system, chemotaxis family, CheB/CheR fusion protein